MKIVMTVLARDNADILDAQIAFHLNVGVDFVIATDNRSVDGTTDILESYERDGVLHLIRESGGGIRQSEWVTRMARLAATDFAADWVLNTDADEFWWPRSGSLRELLRAVPERYGIIQGIWRPFVPRPDDGAFFADRMIVRLSPQAPINDPTSPFRPALKVLHRADQAAVVVSGSHAIRESSLMPLRGWYPVEVLHFPLRTFEQCERKYVSAYAAWQENPRGASAAYHTKAFLAQQAGRLHEYYESLTVDETELARGLSDGSLVVDTRLRGVLAQLRSEGTGERQFRLPASGSGLVLPIPNTVDEAAYASDVAVLEEANLVRLERRLDSLERRLGHVEGRLSNRVRRRLLRLARRR